MKPTPDWAVRRCFNCDVIGHMARDCTQLWCAKCRSVWRSVTDVNYHKMDVCPMGNQSSMAPQMPPARPQMPPARHQMHPARSGHSFTGPHDTRTMPGPYSSLLGKRSVQFNDRLQWPPRGQQRSTDSQQQQSPRRPLKYSGNAAEIDDESDYEAGFEALNTSALSPLQLNTMAAHLQAMAVTRGQEQEPPPGTEDQPFDPTMSDM